MTPSLRPAGVRVPASTSNLGAGFDAIGLAFDRYLTVRWRPGAPPLGAVRTGTIERLDTGDVLLDTFRAALRGLGFDDDPGGVLHAHSDIPVARGLGSSAAARVAGLALAHLVLPDPRLPSLDPRSALFDAAAALEGHPDNASPAVFGGLRASAPSGTGCFTTFGLPLSDDIGFAFAAPDVTVNTGDARAALPAAVPHALAVRNAARTVALVQGLATADPELLRIGFGDELHVPFRLPLIPHGEAALAATLEAGAWAATVSGSGSGLIAACPPSLAAGIADAMADAFGNDAVGFPLRPDREGAVMLEES